MVFRVLGLACAVLALTVLVNASAVQAGDKNVVQDGKIVSVKANKLTMEGKGGKEQAFDVAANAKIMCDGKECNLSDLKTGTRVRVTADAADRATRVEAFLKTNPPEIPRDK